jgi:adenine-specific DNA-methyltransferase
VAVLLERQPPITKATSEVLDQVRGFPRLRFMGSKYKVIPYLVDVFAGLEFDTVLDAFSGSGVVAYALKMLGKTVTANDFLNFTSTIARATVENPGVQLDDDDIEQVLAPNTDGRDFISRTFAGLYFPAEDHAFLDAAWSNIEKLPPYKRELALSALILAAARKQPRGVFTVTSFRYDDGRRSLRLPLRDQFRLTAAAYNAVITDDGQPCKATCQDIFEVEPAGFDLVYFDPPYAPPRDDNDYIKRYHFLEGLSVYWRGQRIMQETGTKKIEKRYTRFAYKHTIRDALRDLFARFRRSTIVLSYSSNSVPDEKEIYELLRAEKKDVQTFAIEHRYHFGTHTTALRRQVHEYIFVAK